MVSVLLRTSALALILLAIPAFFGDFFAYEIGLFLIYGMVAQGIGFLWGKTGILPLGQALFFGLSAYITAMILSADLGVLVTILCSLGSLLALAIFAFGLAAMIFRGRADSGPYFSLITLALVMIAEQLAATSPQITGGFNGLSGFDSFAGLDPFGNLYYLIVALVVLVTLGLSWLNHLPMGLLSKAVFDNEPRLQLLGFPTHLVKASAFGLSAVLAGLAGWLFTSHQGIVTPTSTGFALSAQLVIMTAVGGRFHVLGPLIGAVGIGLASAQLRDQFPYWELVLAVVFIAIVLKAPGGICGLFETIWRKIFPAVDRTRLPNNIAPPAKRAEVTDEALALKDVALQIGPVRILNGVSVQFPATGVIGVIGPNGAGKTSILNTITGNLSITNGRILFGERPIENRLPHYALRSGIGRKLQVPSVFFSLTVDENMALASMAGRARIRDYFTIKTLQWRPAPLMEILNSPDVPLGAHLNHPVGALPQGHRQFLEFAMTAAAEPQVLLLDEPCAGLSPQETKIMTGLVRDFQAKTNALVIMIEHDMSIVEALAKKVLVLHQGAVLAFDTFKAIQANPEVQAVYMGGTK